MSNRSGLISMIWKRLRKMTKPEREKLVGRDVYGNLFYESNKTNFRGQLIRYHTPTGTSDILNKISPEWDAWLRHRRQEPPSEAEVMKNVKISEMKKFNAAAKTEQLIKDHPQRYSGGKSGEFNEFNQSFPKHKGIEDIPGEVKKK